MVGRTLHGNVERDLEAVRLAGRDQIAEVIDRSELGVDGIVAAGSPAEAVELALGR